MSESKLLGRIRKINTILVLIVCLGVLSFFAYLMGLALWDSSSTQYETPGIRVGGEQNEAPDLSLGRFTRLPGLDLVKAPLQGEAESYHFSSSDSSVTHNYLFFSLEDSTSFWLLENNRSIIEWTQVVTQREEDGAVSGVPDWKADDKRCGRAIAVLYQVTSEDTNGDGKLTYRDSGTLAASRPDGKGFKTLVEGVDRIRSFETNTAGHGVVFYISEGALRAVRLDLSTLSILKDTDISAQSGLNRVGEPDSG